MWHIGVGVGQRTTVELRQLQSYVASPPLPTLQPLICRQHLPVTVK